jgi:hypothetical protein
VSLIEARLGGIFSGDIAVYRIEQIPACSRFNPLEFDIGCDALAKPYEFE